MSLETEPVLRVPVEKRTVVDEAPTRVTSFSGVTGENQPNKKDVGAASGSRTQRADRSEISCSWPEQLELQRARTRSPLFGRNAASDPVAAHVSTRWNRRGRRATSAGVAGWPR
jgi:hypothetical protein